MLARFLERLRDEGPNLPNRFTVALGKLIRDARVGADMSQKELAEAAYFRQSSISKIEAGTRAVTVEDLLYLSYALDKPISYFLPPEFVYKVDDEDLTVLERELLAEARKLSKDDLRRLVAQARGLTEFTR